MDTYFRRHDELRQQWESMDEQMRNWIDEASRRGLLKNSTLAKRVMHQSLDKVRENFVIPVELK